MFKKTLTGLALVAATCGIAHAGWDTMSSVTGHATVKAENTWSITETKAGLFKPDGTMTTPLTIEVKNINAELSGRYALEPTEAKYGDKSQTWKMLMKGDETKVINIQPTNLEALNMEWDATRMNYRQTAAVGNGHVDAIEFAPVAGQTLAAGEYEIGINLMVEHP